MKKFKRLYKKLISFLLFITFFGVIISDVVSFHLQHIYHIELIKDNLEFVKLSKDNSKSTKKLVPTISFVNNQFFITNITDEITSSFLEDYLFTEKFCFKKSIQQFNILPLRAPPVC